MNGRFRPIERVWCLLMVRLEWDGLRRSYRRFYSSMLPDSSLPPAQQERHECYERKDEPSDRPDNLANFDPIAGG